MTPFASRAATAALAITAATLIAACGAEEGGAVATTAGSSAAAEPSAAARSTVEIRAVALAAPVADTSDPLRKDDIELGDMLADLGLDESPDTVEAAEWFTVGDCAADPVSSTDAAAACSTHSSEVFLLGPTALDGSHISGSELVEDDGSGDSLNITLTEAGTAAMADLTGAAVASPAPGNRIAILLDGLVISATTVKSVIDNGEVTIIGDEHIRELAEALG
ncbi:SecDF P1 head subdomain-containing protein [Demequina sp. SO4-18]|uniref:SecDF P1 head subdomain-containing protein n=1 Tax=Demequina sp. SO4-18 TaxID=3401026 RepID=UPI003B5A6FB8